MILLRAAIFCLMLSGTLYYVFSTWALIRHFYRSRHYPECRPYTVSILKPVCGFDPNIEDNLRSFLAECQPGRELLLGVLEPDDPALPVLRQLATAHPSISLHSGSTINGANNKARVLHTLARQARGEILLITDADTRAEPGFIDRIVTTLADPDVGAVTCLYKGVNARSLGDALEALHMTCVFAPGVASHNALAGIDFGLGAAIAVRAETLQKAGGFETLADYLADDFQLGRIVSKTGRRVVLSREVIGIVLGGGSLRTVLERELRWSVTTRISRPWGHLGLIFTFGFAYAVAFAALVKFSWLGWAAIAGVVLTRQLTAWLGASCLGDKALPRRAYLLPVRDMLSFAIWLASFFVRSVKWRGRTLRLLKHGKIAPYILALFVSWLVSGGGS